MFINVNKVKIYYEKSGSGKPVILLHGNGEDHHIFDALTEKLKMEYTVYALDTRGHGGSSAVDSFHYQDMMEDVAAFIRLLRLEEPVLYGFSDGGIVGLLLAAQYPGVLSHLLVSGVNVNPKGLRASFSLLTKLQYFFTRDTKLKLMLEEPDITEAALHQITIPVLFLAGEKDVVKETHTRQIAHAVKNGTLKILPGETHDSYVIKKAELYDLIKGFLPS